MWFMTKLVIAGLALITIAGAMTHPYISAHGFQRVPAFHTGTQRAMMVAGAVVLLLFLLFWKDPQKPE
jgi:hypothetical protein